jgi:hypothetical protein
MPHCATAPVMPHSHLLLLHLLQPPFTSGAPVELPRSSSLCRFLSQDICEAEATFDLNNMRGEGLCNRACCFLHPILGEMVAITVTCEDNIQLIFKTPSAAASPQSSPPARNCGGKWACVTRPSPVKRPACISAVSHLPFVLCNIVTLCFMLCDFVTLCRCADGGVTCCGRVV